MFNIIETLQNYFTHKLLPYSLTSLQRKVVAAIFGGKLFVGSVFASHCCTYALNTVYSDWKSSYFVMVHIHIFKVDGNRVALQSDVSVIIWN